MGVEPSGALNKVLKISRNKVAKAHQQGNHLEQKKENSLQQPTHKYLSPQ